MNLFETVKASVSVPAAAKMYGLQANYHGMAKCLFHDDRHPSMKLNEDYFYCFGCGATGDVIDLVVKLLDLRPYEAAKKLAVDFGIDPDKPPSAAVLAKPKHPMIRAFRNDERYCQRVLICTFWKAGRFGTHQKTWTKTLMIGSWKPAKCSITSNIWQTS